MLIRLLRQYLRPYRRELTIVVVLQLVSTIAVLYLPSLNGDIIDQGVAKGDTGYIMRAGGLMLLVTVVQIVGVDRRCLLWSARGDGLRPRPARAASSAGSASSPPARWPSSARRR